MFVGIIGGGSSKLVDGPLGVVKLGFKGYDLGKTTAETTMKLDQDIKDIIYQQDGTKAADKVRTGQVVMISGTLGEVKTKTLALLQAGITAGHASADDDFGVIGRSVYQSMRENEVGGLKIAACSADGLPSEEPEDQLCFYEAIFNLTRNFINWGADVQRALPFEIYVFFHPFEAGESETHRGAYGYWGDPEDSDVPAITWPDVAAPVVTSVEVEDATTLTVTFDKPVTEVDEDTTEDKIIASVDGAFVAPTALAIVDNVLTLTFSDATFTAGDEVLFSMSAGVVEDTAENQNAVVASRRVTNDLA